MKCLDFINAFAENISPIIIKYISKNLEIWERQERNTTLSRKYVAKNNEIHFEKRKALGDQE
jgi:uncharacterized protein YwgA